MNAQRKYYFAQAKHKQRRPQGGQVQYRGTQVYAVSTGVLPARLLSDPLGDTRVALKTRAQTSPVNAAHKCQYVTIHVSA